MSERTVLAVLKRMGFVGSGLFVLVLMEMFSGQVKAQAPSAEFQAYQARCSFCHQVKPANALPNMQAWTRLLYTSACPEVSLKLTEQERRLIKVYLERSLQAEIQQKTLDEVKQQSKKESDRSSERSKASSENP